jgi:hypothetical protein
MQEHVDLDRLTRRTRRLEYEDGLTDLQNALVFLLLGLAGGFFMSPLGIRFYVRSLLEYEDLTMIGLIGLFALFVFVTFGARRLIMRYRREVLWKNIGQVEPLRWQVDSRVSILAAAVWLVVVIVGMVLFSGDPMDLDASMRVVIAAGGLATGLIYLMLGRTLQVNRFQWLGITAGLASGALMILPISAAAGWAAFGVIWAVGLSISGLSAYRGLRAAEKQG